MKCTWKTKLGKTTFEKSKIREIRNFFFLFYWGFFCIFPRDVYVFACVIVFIYNFSYIVLAFTVVRYKFYLSLVKWNLVSSLKDCVYELFQELAINIRLRNLKKLGDIREKSQNCMGTHTSVQSPHQILFGASD